MAKSSVSMKLLIDTRRGKRVVFAEAGKDCVDFLFHILSLPIATVIRLLQAEGMEGSLPNLHRSLKNLDDTYILPNASKATLLKPAAPPSPPPVPLLTLNRAPAQKKFYGCSNNTTTTTYYGYNNKPKCNECVSDDALAVCPSCSQRMTRQLSYVSPPAVQADESGVVKGVVTYMVTDDLVVQPMSTISSIALLTKFNVKDMGALEEKVVNLGMNEALKLVKASLCGKTVLTDVFC